MERISEGKLRRERGVAVGDKSKIKWTDIALLLIDAGLALLIIAIFIAAVRPEFRFNFESVHP